MKITSIRGKIGKRRKNTTKKQRISNFEQNESLHTSKHLKGLGVAKLQRNLAQVCQRYVAGTILTGRKIRAVLPGETKRKCKEKTVNLKFLGFRDEVSRKSTYSTHKASGSGMSVR